MSQARHPSASVGVDLTHQPARVNDPVYQAYQLLHVGFTIAPIVAGLDKFFHVLVNWDAYLAPIVDRALAGHGHTFMLIAGVVEIAVGIGVALRPKIFSYGTSEQPPGTNPRWIALIGSKERRDGTQEQRPLLA